MGALSCRVILKITNGKVVAPNFYRMLVNILMQRFPVMEEFRPDLPEKDRREIFCRFVLRQIASTMSGRRFFITNKGFMGVQPSNAGAGDAVCITFGACTRMYCGRMEIIVISLVKLMCMALWMESYILV
jgi:hypothetical protein